VRKKPESLAAEPSWRYYRLPDPSTPVGVWYLNAAGEHFTLVVESDGPRNGLNGRLAFEDGRPDETLDSLRWSEDERLLHFRWIRENQTEWYRMRLVHGVWAGRFSFSEDSTSEPEDLTAFVWHVTGWGSQATDAGITPRVYTLTVNYIYQVTLRIDRNSTLSGLIGRFKVHANTSLRPPQTPREGEELEYEIEVLDWDGTNLRFVRRGPGLTQVYTGFAFGRRLKGFFTQSGVAGEFPFEGTRAQVLSYGLRPKSPDKRDEWQRRTRAQLAHLGMGDDPVAGITVKATLGATTSPFNAQLVVTRDDGAQGAPMYSITEFDLQCAIPNPYDGPPMARHVHGYWTRPDTPPPRGGYPLAVILNGHGGSAHIVMEGANNVYWYGDAYARAGFVVLAVDILHRPPADRSNLYPREHGSDPYLNPNPSIKADGFDSDWSEDGERVWDVMRAIDYVLAAQKEPVYVGGRDHVPRINPSRIIVSGLSMGAEEALLTAAFDPRVAMSVPACYSPDINVLAWRGPSCWMWNWLDICEYVDTSDFCSLIAPRPLLIETGKQDYTYHLPSVNGFPPFASDKQVARRARVAYCLLYTSPSPRDLSTSRMPSSA